MKIQREDQVKRYMDWQEFDIAIDKLVKQIQSFEKTNSHFNAIYGVPRGGLIVGVVLSHRLNREFTTNPISYDRVLICDDIADSGETLLNYRNEFFKKHGMKIAVLFWKVKSKVNPDFYYKGLNEKLWAVFPWER